MNFRELLEQLQEIQRTNPEALDQTATFVEPYDEYEVRDIELRQAGPYGIMYYYNKDVEAVPPNGYYFE